MDEMLKKVQTGVSYKDWIWRLLVSLLLWFVADVVAVVLFYWNPPVIGYSERSHLLMELFSFTHMLALLGVGALWYPLCRTKKSYLYPFFAGLLLGGVYLTLFQYLC